MPPLRLEVFEETTQPKADTVVTDLSALEEARLASYEQGYSAGWEDATSAQKDEKALLAAELSRNLQALSFTYHEARVHVLRALEPLLIGMVDQILPQIARDTLGPTVLKALTPLAEEMAETPIKLLFNPVARPALETMLLSLKGPPLELIEEPTLGEAQVYLRLGESEVRVDLEGAITEIRTALTDFLTLSTKDLTHG
ncbi:flagellar biosynthesis protein [Pseudorhodobacter sp. E13]|uniref:FliH/SctL family protein n=1 Tax=Pseudorhodobacter sp. E13 TaxID=2487931 RepID=UPI000F8E6315|nr:flagellar biosynthesis protein [Pseudorhodobacter sp. E13]RUS64923.1 flagellar biosynthesis protein [Pseudorhodobacter sp. E13]